MKKIITLSMLFLTIVCFSQRKFAADKYFSKFAYIKSAELYEAILKKGDTSKQVLSRLGDSYYFNSITEKSEVWYKKLFSLYEKEGIESEYYYRLSQSLKSNKKYKEADAWLLKFRELNKDDSRGSRITSEANYLDKYTNQKGIYITINNLSSNTEYSDYGAFKINNLIYFSSTRPSDSLSKPKLYSWNKQPYLNIYKGKESVFTKNNSKKSLDVTSYEKVNGINTVYHDASAVVTKDGKTMYFTRDNFDGKKLGTDKKRVSHLKIYKASLKEGVWADVIELPFNNDDYSVGHPALSKNEKELYFVSDMQGGFGHTDLYKVEINTDGTYSRPQNLGKEINTEGREMFPFVLEDVLFFSSDGHLGLGGLDVFTSKMTLNGYESPKNIGAPINSSKDDFSFSIDQEKKEGYFSSNREGGKGDDDIYSFVFFECKEAISGVTYNKKDGSILPNVAVKLLDAEGKVLEIVKSDASGVYMFANKDCNVSYTVVGDLQYFVSDSDTVQMLAIDQKIIPSKLYLKPLIVDNQIVINPIFFDFDKSNIRPDAEYELEKVITVMQEYPELIIKIESHTDSRGNDNYNRRLSDRRAKSSRDYIISRGIDASRIESAIGFGEDKLLNECDDANAKKCTEEQHQKNRRSYFYIVKGKGKVTSSNE
ncbi:MAG: OmpA family protein [Flavobacteriaceae bacterium]